MTVAPARRVPVLVVTGYLGSGKTTLISSILRFPEMAGTALVVNEFGAVGIDDVVLRQVAGPDGEDGRTPVTLLTNGCMCCAAGSDLAIAVLDLLSPREGLAGPRRIVIEASGAADTIVVLKKLMGDPRLRRAIRLDGVVATVDAVNFLRSCADDPLVARQLAVADRRVITKTDIADAADVSRIRTYLDSLNPGASTIDSVSGCLEPAVLFGASLYDEKAGRADPTRWLNAKAYAGHRQHHQSVRSWVISAHEPVDWAAAEPRIGRWLGTHGAGALRLKGLVHTRNDPRPLVIHGVQGMFHRPVEVDPPSPGDTTTFVVLIAGAELGSAIADLADIFGGTLTGVPGSKRASHEGHHNLRRNEYVQ